MTIDEAIVELHRRVIESGGMPDQVTCIRCEDGVILAEVYLEDGKEVHVYFERLPGFNRRNAEARIFDELTTSPVTSTVH